MMVTSHRRSIEQPSSSSSSSQPLLRTILTLFAIASFCLVEYVIVQRQILKHTVLENETEEWKRLYLEAKQELQNHDTSLQKEILPMQASKGEWMESISNIRNDMREISYRLKKQQVLYETKYKKSQQNLNKFKNKFKELNKFKDKFEESQSNLFRSNDRIKELLKEQNKDKLNILLLYADDWRYDTFASAGNPIIKTPNLDKLAKNGMMFTHNCVTTSVCWISRGTLQTGQYLSRHQSPNIAEPNFMNEGKWNETLNVLLNKQGYYTGYFGKWHYYRDPPYGFDAFEEYYGWHWDEGEQITQKNERDALRFLKNRPRDIPFALTVAFFATHAMDSDDGQFYPQPESMGLYNDTDIPKKASVCNESWLNLPEFFTERNEGRIRWHWRFDDEEKYQKMMKNYYRMATEVDTACGNIIKELEEQGILNNTLVIFTTDNGYYHGEHGLADKWYAHEESIRVPLVIQDPRMHESKIGTKNDDLTLNIDLAPTLLHAAGITPPERMQGRDISSLYTSDSKDPNWRTEFFYEHPTIFDQEWWIPTSEALVRKDFKYMLWPFYEREQLFDLVNDPLEENDLFGKKGYQAKLKEMRKRFLELKKEAQ